MTYDGKDQDYYECEDCGEVQLRYLFNGIKPKDQKCRECSGRIYQLWPDKPKDRTGLVQIGKDGIITTVQYDDETVCGIKIVHDLKEARKDSVKIEFGEY